MQPVKLNSTFDISRVTGILFLISLVVPTLNWVFIISRFVAPGSNTSQNILNQEFLFRINILLGIASTTIILALALCLFSILKSANRTMALLAFSLKMIEVVLTATLALAHFVALLVLKGEPHRFTKGG